MGEAGIGSDEQAIAQYVLRRDGNARACLDHGRRVCDSLDCVLGHTGLSGASAERLAALHAGALLHGLLEDRGRLSLSSAESGGWSITPAQIVNEVPLADVADRQLVTALLEDVNSTAGLFPRNGRPNECAAAERGERSHASQHLVDLFTEADSLVHLEQPEVEQAVASWRRSGLPLATPGIGCATPWAWEVSIIGNLRLTGRRALLDARTTEGWAQAKRGYVRLERLIRALCDEEGLRYERDLCDPIRLVDGPQPTRSERRPALWVQRFYGWEELQKRLREVPLLYSHDVFPYRAAEVRLAVVLRRDITPISHYALRERLGAMERLNATLTKSLGMCIWDLPGLAILGQAEADEMLICPPVTEIHTRREMDRLHTARRGNERVLIDGLHRAYLAGQRPGQRMRVIEISGVPYPPIAFASSWNAVVEYDSPPARTEDRRWYRYAEYSDYMKEPFSRQIPATPKDFTYVLYRDLSGLGSPGSRLHATHDARSKGSR